MMILFAYLCSILQFVGIVVGGTSHSDNIFRSEFQDGDDVDFIQKRVYVNPSENIANEMSKANEMNEQLQFPDRIRTNACNGTHPCRGFAGCAGMPSEWVQLRATILGLRSHGNMDPVQVFHVNGELSLESISDLERLSGVRVHDFKEVVGNKVDIMKYRGYSCGSMALLVSSFDQVMVIGGDGIFFTNPSFLWESPTVQDTGALFVRDRFLPNSRPSDEQSMCDWLRDTAYPYLSSINPSLNVTLGNFESRHPWSCSRGSGHEADSNLVFFDKTRKDIQQVLKIVYHLQEKYMDSAPVHGEKEWYWMACELAGAACVDSFVESGAVTFFNRQEGDSYCGDTGHVVGDTLISGNFAGDAKLETFVGVTLPSKEVPICGTPDWLCCTAPAGVRQVVSAEKKVFANWVDHCIRGSNPLTCLSNRGDTLSLLQRALSTVDRFLPSPTDPRTHSAAALLVLDVMPSEVTHTSLHWLHASNPNPWSLVFIFGAMPVVLAMVVYLARYRGASWHDIYAVAIFFAVNPAMLFVNKVAVTVFPLPATLMFLQFVFTAVVLRSLGVFQNITGIEVEHLHWDKVKPFFPVALTLMLQVLANMEALKDQPLEVMICARSILPLLLLVPDYFLIGIEFPSHISMLCLSGVASCMTLFASRELQHMSSQSITWILTWLGLLVFDAVLVKRVMMLVAMSNWTRAYYTNALAILPLAILAISTCEWSTAPSVVQEMAISDCFAVFLSCVLSVAMSYASYLVRDIFITSTGALVTTSCKWLVILVNNLVWDQHTSSFSTWLVFLCLCLGLGYTPPRKLTDANDKPCNNAN